MIKADNDVNTFALRLVVPLASFHLVFKSSFDSMFLES
jgi:hypothetical protein